MNLDGWLGVESPLAAAVEKTSRDQLAAYQKHPPLILEHANQESEIVSGGYGRKQLYELVQNAADELIGRGGRVEVVLTKDALYCANEGDAFTVQGATTLLGSHVSTKRGVEIGRFGLGFKSVLGVTSRPEIFSRSGSFGFDATRARDAILRAVPGQTATPTLRVGFALDPRDEAATDETLKGLMSWATTVIRLPRDERADWLHEDFETFPAEFLIFSTHVTELVLDDNPSHNRRDLKIDGEGSKMTLSVNGAASEWHVFSEEYRPSSAAKTDGGYSAERDVVPIYWAVAGPRLGRLWAFFPTQETVTASGIFNAPWKLNSDRTAVIEGQFNEELLAEAARLFLEGLPVICPPEDPGAILEMLPARGRELRGYADERLSHHIGELAPAYPCIPDQSGELVLPATLTLPPADLPAKALVLWSKSPFRPTDWCHNSIDTQGQRPTRRARAERLIADGSGRRADVRQWLEVLIDQEHLIESSCRALYAAAAAVPVGGDIAAQIRTAAIVVTEDGQTVAPAPGHVFLPPKEEVKTDVQIVHPDVVADEYAVEALVSLGITEVSPESLLDARLSDARAAKPGSDWSAIWELSRRCGDGMFVALLRRHQIEDHQISVITRGGGWSRLGGVLLPGRVIRENEADDGDARALIDTDWHARDLSTLKSLGAREGPVARAGSLDEPWAAEYKAAALKEYDRVSRRQNSLESLQFEDLGRFAGPATPLRLLGPKAGARFLNECLRNTQELGSVSVRHRTNSKLPQVVFPHPLVWLIQQRGQINTSLGPVSLDLAVSPALQHMKRFLPVADVVDTVAVQLKLATRLEDLTERQRSILVTRLLTVDSPDELVSLYLAVAEHVPRPSEINAIVGGRVERVQASEVAVATNDREARLLRASGKPFLLGRSTEDAERLADHWELKHAADLISSELAVIPASDGEPLGDVFPMLRTMLPARDADIQLQRCTELRRDFFTDSGRQAEPLTFERDDDHVYVLDSLTDGEILTRVSDSFGLSLDEQAIEDVLANATAQIAAELKRRMRAAVSDGERLLVAIPADVLRQRLPAELVEAYAAEYGTPDDQAVGDLTLAVLGLESLAKLSPLLNEAGLQPPSKWAGSRRAIEFVNELGFDRGFAGFKSEGREADLDVSGPIDLPELHDYQRTAANAIKDLTRGDGGLRGMLSLPTGAGKTRVTVQALIEAMRDEQLASPLLWIAQSDELCEQAVQSWVEVWRALGPPEAMRVSRLWSSNEVSGVDEGHQVVVATIDKLRVCSEKPAYEWLSEATCVVIDEAHGSTETEYTRVLAWLGMARGRERVPLIGLSATPFRGVSESENNALAARYSKRRLDRGVFSTDEPTIAYLQDLGVLAHVDHQVLEGASLPLSDAELAELEQRRTLPPSVLNRLGEDVDRNRTLIKSILEQSADWPILVFASSVPHAQTLAALLNKEGRRSASVSGETPAAIRRYMIDRFKVGEIKVLTNYAVLTQGFDAPAIRALYIARPTYSPNRYQQMVGRGLRGKLNNGKERCLIVNVRDNLERYQGTLAFEEFDYLWTS
jgi:superfamily II DNA or RNA helicase